MRHLRETQKRKVALIYQKSVLTTWHEVDNALVGLPKRSTVLTMWPRPSRAMDYLFESRRIIISKVLAIVWMSFSRKCRLFQQQQSLAQAETEVVNLVTIYIALGGGWQAAD
jgi:hypothetical protein